MNRRKKARCWWNWFRKSNEHVYPDLALTEHNIQREIQIANDLEIARELQEHYIMRQQYSNKYNFVN